MTPLSGPVRRTLPATRQAVDDFCADLRANLLASLPANERFAVELLLREALINAVVHGTADQVDAEIGCELRPIEGGIEIRVSDGGAGFDWRNRAGMEPAAFAESGRGLLILRRYASNVQFSSSGNQVAMTRMFSPRGIDEL